MDYVRNNTTNYFRATNRQYDIMLIDPRGVLFYSDTQLIPDWLVSAYDLWI